MNVQKKGHTSIITFEKGEKNNFVEKISENQNSFKDENIIVDLSSAEDLSLEDILSFLPISDEHRRGKKSFVIVAPNFDFNEVPDEIVVVPTILEAHDIIEMEEIERDLGF